MIPVVISTIIGISPTAIITGIIVTSPTTIVSSVISTIITSIVSVIPGITIIPAVIIGIGTSIPTVSPIPAIVAVGSPEIIIPEWVGPRWGYPGIRSVNVNIPVIVIQKVNISVLRV
jgi:hypothetical protein